MEGLASEIARPRSERTSLHDVLDGLEVGVLVVDVSQRVHVVNAVAKRLLGMPPHDRRTRPRLRHVLASAHRLDRATQERLHAFCERAIQSNSQEPVALNHGINAVFRRISPDRWSLTMRAAADGIADEPALDPLTGLANRRAFWRRLSHLLAFGAGKPTILLVDLDRFKPVNDTLGHAVGDAVLCAVADRLRGAVRSEDVVARIGADEFAVLLRNGHGMDEAAALSARLIDLLGQPYAIDGHLVSLGASIGFVLVCDDRQDADEWMRSADLALHHAKSDGRGVWRAFEPEMNSQAQARRRLETDLRRAAAGRQWVLHYQPQYNLTDSRLTGFEALIRWLHPIRGLVPPNDFIPLSEELGLIHGIGAWALQTACAEAARWPDPLWVAVNVSPLQFEYGEKLVRMVADTLTESGLPPSRLELEITESVLLGAKRSALRTLHSLRDLGVRIAMDDFGTGYSSLSQLRSFPFDKIKIDRSFVRDIAESAQAQAVVRAITDLSLSLGMSVLAEGVETKEQAAAVAAGSCSDIQGYLIGRPVPAQDLQGIIARLAPASAIMPGGPPGYP